MFLYDFDLLDDNYTKFTGNVDSFNEILSLIAADGNIIEFVGRVKVDSVEKFEICIASINDIGVFIGVTLGKKEYLSLDNKESLSELIDVWGDELNVSRGLFLQNDRALEALLYILNNKELCAFVDWISPDDLPEDGNYII